MKNGRAGRKPTFFWQGLLVLLPLVLLSVVGLVSLRQDEQAAEQEARRKAAENVRSLARAIGASVSEELHAFLVLERGWEIEARLAGQASVVHTNGSAGFTFPSEKLKLDVERWEGAYPNLKLAGLTAAEGMLLCDGRQIQPPEVPMVPEPPKWFRDLSPRQRELWEALRRAVEAKRPAASIQAARQAFVETDPGREASQAALYLDRTPEQLLERGLPRVATESGLSFQDIACFRWLRSSQQPVSGPLLEAVWWQVIESGSFVSPMLLELTESLSGGATPEVRDELRWTRQFWQSQVRARAWLTPLRESPEIRRASRESPQAHWTQGEPGEALAISDPVMFEKMGADSEGIPLSGPGYTISFVPRPVIEAIFARALAENRFLIPEYASAWLTVEGMPLSGREPLAQERPLTPALSPSEGERENSRPVIHPSLGSSVSQAGPGKSLLAGASQKFGKSSEAGAASFELKFYLASHERMLATEQRRGRLFVGLIGASSLAALFGLGAAYRAFHRQLQLNEMKSNFVASVSHELRAPIASVRLMAESLERGKISEAPRQQEYFRFIGQECRRLSALIENVLDFSRIEQGRKQYEFEPTDLLALTQQTVKLMETYAAERQIRLQLTLAEPQLSTIHYQVSGDGKALQQALVNLIDNAIKHSPKGGSVAVGLEVQGPKSKVQSPKSKVQSPREDRGSTVEGAGTDHASTLECSRFTHHTSHITLWVEDHGEGIPPQEHEKIFERFYRLGSELRRETQGVGIGLSIVKHVVEAHGGRVVVRSAVGQGSRFTIELPFVETTPKSEVRNPKSEAGSVADFGFRISDFLKPGQPV